MCGHNKTVDFTHKISNMALSFQSAGNYVQGAQERQHFFDGCFGVGILLIPAAMLHNGIDAAPDEPLWVIRGNFVQDSNNLSGRTPKMFF